MPENATDVILGIVQASVALAGLLLVFSGFLFGQAASLPPATTDDAIIDRFRRAGRSGIWPFLGSIAISVAATAWLIWPGCMSYYLVVALFVTLLVATAIYGAVVVWRYL